MASRVQRWDRASLLPISWLCWDAKVYGLGSKGGRLTCMVLLTDRRGTRYGPRHFARVMRRTPRQDSSRTRLSLDLAGIRSVRADSLRGVHPVAFDESRDLLFTTIKRCSPVGPGMRFRAFDGSGNIWPRNDYLIGGGDYLREGEGRSPQRESTGSLPLERRSIASHRRRNAARDLADRLEKKKSGIRNEVREYVRRIWEAMQECVKRGLRTEGILPGGLNVRRRAPRLAKILSANLNLNRSRRWIG